MYANWEGFFPILGTVIIVEDDPILLMLLRYILTDMGANPVTFPSADAALAYSLQTHDHCVLVITDQGLPGKIQGSQFIEMVSGKWPSVRSILTSGYLLDPEIIPRDAAFLAKPWSPDQLIATVANLLQLNILPLPTNHSSD